MRQKQQNFYRLFGMRLPEQMLKPRLIPIKRFELPLDAIYHFFDDSTAVLGPNPQDPMFLPLKGRVFIEHVTELVGTEGGPRRTVLNPTTMANDFRRKNRMFKPLRKDEALSINHQNVLVVNYSMLNPLYRYIVSYKASYYRWKNNAITFWSNMASVCERFEWNQYLELHLPDRIPKLSEFRLLEAGLTQKTLETFATPSQLSLHDLYLWLGENRALSTLSLVPEKHWHKINFIVRAKSYFFTINLKQLDDWRKKPEEKGAKGYDPAVMQRRFLALALGIKDFIAGAAQLENEDRDGAADLAVSGKIIASVDKEAKAPADVVEAPIVDEDDAHTPTQATPIEREAEVSDDEIPLPDIDFGFDFDAPAPVAPPAMDSRMADDDDDDFEEEAPQTVVEEDPIDDLADAEHVTTDDLLTQSVINRAWELSEAGLISPRAYQRAIDDANRYHELPDPFGSGQSIAEAMVITPEDLELPEEESFPDTQTVPDKSMLKSKLKNMQRRYVQNVLPKDIMQSVLGAVQQQGASVVGYEIEEVRDTMNHYQVHAITIKPLRGKQTTVRFRVPVIDSDGRFVSNGVTYRMRLQRADKPIRKVSPSRVALTSYYNKTFVDRSERAVNNYDRWITRIISERGLSLEDQSITDLRFGELKDMTLRLPRVYTQMAKRFLSFKAGKFEFFFDYPAREEFFTQALNIDVKTLETQTQVAVGTYDNQLVVVDSNNAFYVHTPEGLEVLGTITDILGIETTKAPLEVAEMSVSNKILPVGFVLGYQLGLSELIKLLGAEVSRHRRGERILSNSDEYQLVFQDEVLVFSKHDYRASLILAGFNRYHRNLKDYSVWDFDKPDVYYRVLEENGLGIRYLREITALFSAWVDPITRGLLEMMNEPTEFGALLIRSVELLMTDYSASEVEATEMRYRGYERLAGMVYGELSRAVKTYNNRAASSETGVELNPHAVWQKIVQDPAVSAVEDSNPMANLREQESMTYGGDGGRGGISMVERTRVYGDSDVGVVSESTVDSGDVGVIAYLSPDANFTNLRGYTRTFDKETDGAAKILSSSALTAPCAEHDDPKRINFIAIQQQQGIYADGYEVTPLRTGYEQVIAQRTSSIFATTADLDGEVVEVSKRAIVVRYSDGTEVRIELGLRHGTAAGVVYPHDVVTSFKVGDTFKRGDTLAYNRKYFTHDRMHPGQVAWKAGVLVRTAFIDNIDTLEDGSAISERVAKLMNTQTTEVKTIQVRFDQVVHDLVKVGDHVDLETILCTIEDPETANNTLFGDAALDTLRRLSAATPKAKVVGTVSKIEVFYHGDFEDMSDNLQAIAAASDKERRALAKAMGQKAFTGQVDTSFRVKGKALDPDTLAIKVYIDHDVPCGVGDKGVFGNQMKTVISRVMAGTNATEDGQPLDAIFGNTSVEARIVISPKLIGTTNMLLKVLSKHVAAVYRGTANEKAKRKS